MTLKGSCRLVDSVDLWKACLCMRECCWRPHPKFKFWFNTIKVDLLHLLCVRARNIQGVHASIATQWKLKSKNSKSSVLHHSRVKPPSSDWNMWGRLAMWCALPQTARIATHGAHASCLSRKNWPWCQRGKFAKQKEYATHATVDQQILAYITLSQQIFFGRSV